MLPSYLLAEEVVLIMPLAELLGHGKMVWQERGLRNSWLEE
jgi:hypothetical protein